MENTPKPTSELLELLYSNNPNPAMVINSSLIVIDANDSAAKKFMFNSTSEMVGKKLGEFLFSNNLQTLFNKSGEGEIVYGFELIQPSSNGDNIYFSTNLYPKKIKDDLYCLIFLIDVTEDIKREMDLHALNIALEEAHDEIIKSREGSLSKKSLFQ